jgi:hypothetical protein
VEAPAGTGASLARRAETPERNLWEEVATMDMTTLLIVVLVVAVLGGGGWGYSRYRR